MLVSLLSLALGARAAAADAIVVGHTTSVSSECVSHLKTVAGSSGLHVEERILPSDAAMVSALVQGEIAVAIGAPELAIAARGRGAPVLVVSGFSRSRARIVARRSLHAERVADLAHRRVGVSRGGTNELLLLSELRAASLTWSDDRGRDVQLVYLAPADLDPALRSGYVDAVVQPDALAARAIRTGYAVEIQLTRGERLDALLTTEQVYGERRALARLVESLVDASRLPDPHPQLAYAIKREDVDDTARRMAELGVGGASARDGLVTQLVKLDLVEEAAARAASR